jgi:acetyl esterase/lipase
VRRFLVGLLVACAILGAVTYAFKVSPWPSAMVVRLFFDWQGRATAAALDKYVPKDVIARLDEQYAADNDAKLDIFYPARTERSGEMLPTVVWVHGGGWVAGDKSHIANYLEILAAHGYTTVGVNYSLAPGATYPTPVRQVNAALRYLTGNASRFHIDGSRFFLAGDSAGSQIAAELANAISVVSYASQIDVMPSIERSQLRGVVLYCGAYDLSRIDPRGTSVAFSAFVRTVLWSYAGTKDFMDDPRLAPASVARFVTPAFPPMFISGGNHDPLTPQSREMAEAVVRQGVQVDSLFYPADYKPALPHEYQFNLDTAAGKTALERSLQFLAAQSR